MTNTIKMKVDEKKLIANMKDAFTNDMSVITELAQNARRAGATEVHFIQEGLADTYDYTSAGTKFNLTVVDNGNGVDDLQSMLSVASSGWDEKIMKEESPFGMGFLMAIYLSESITVASKGKQFTATREQLLNLEDIHIVDSTVTKGTEITLSNVVIRGISTSDKLDERLGELLTSFPIQVFTTEGEIERWYTQESLETNAKYLKHEYSKCTAFIRKDLRLDYSNPTLTIFQGLIVAMDSSYYSQNFSDCKVDFIIFANDSMGTIRLPDRAQFVNKDEVYTYISNHKENLTTELITTRKDDFSFLAKNVARLAKYGCLHLLNDHDEIPAGLVEKFSSSTIPNSVNEEYDNTNRIFDYDFDLEDYSKERLSKLLVLGYGYNFEENFSLDEKNTNYQAMAMLLESGVKDYCLVDHTKLAVGHWVNTLLTPFSDMAETIVVTPENFRDPVIKPTYTDFESEVKVVMCDSYSISATVGETKYVYEEEKVYACVITIDETDVVLIPSDLKYDCISQISNYLNDGEMVDESRKYQYEQGFDKWLARERSVDDPELYFKNVFREFSFAHLNGKEFKLSINDGNVAVATL